MILPTVILSEDAAVSAPLLRARRIRVEGRFVLQRTTGFFSPPSPVRDGTAGGHNDGVFRLINGGYRAFTVFPFFILTSSFLIVLGLVSSFCALEHNIPHPKRCTFFCFGFMELSVLASTLAFGG